MLIRSRSFVEKKHTLGLEPKGHFHMEAQMGGLREARGKLGEMYSEKGVQEQTRHDAEITGGAPTRSKAHVIGVAMLLGALLRANLDTD